MKRNSNLSMLLLGLLTNGLALHLSSLAFAQDRALDENQAERRSSPGILSKMFGSSSSKTSKNTTSGGLLVPLKSLSRTLQNGVKNSDDAQPSDEQGTIEYQRHNQDDGSVEPPAASDSPASSPKRERREPFSKTPATRTPERPARQSNGTQGDRLDVLAPVATPAPSVSRDGVTKSNRNESNTNSTNIKSLPTLSKSEPVVDSNKTSRRTASDPSQVIDTQLEAELLSSSKPGQAPSLISVATNKKKIPAEPVSVQRSNVAKDLALETVSTEMKPATDSVKLARRTSTATAKNPIAPTPVAADAKATGNVSKSNVASTPNDREVLREMAIPKTRLSVVGPNELLINKGATYEVIARNDSDDALNGLMVRVTVPTGVQVGDIAASDGIFQADTDENSNAILWELEKLPGNTSKSLRLVLTASKPEHFALGIEWTVIPQAAEVQLNVQQPQLQLALEGPSEVDYGKPQTYRMRVRNPGNAVVKDVSVSLSAEPFGSNQSQIGDVPAGGERVVEVDLTFQQPGTLPIVATASSTVSKLDASSSIDVSVRVSELAATWFGPSEFYQGSIADYDLELTNSGSIAGNSVICKVRLPAGADVVGLPPGAQRAGEFVRWEIKKIDPNEKLTFPFRLLLSKLGDNQLSLIAECQSGSEIKAEFVTAVDAIADLHLTVNDPPAPAPIGQPVTYEIVIMNRGKKAAVDIDIVAQFSEGIEPIRIEGQTGRIVPGQVLFDPIASIGPNEKLTLKVLAEASKPGAHRFRVEVKSQNGDGDLIGEESTRFLSTSVRSERR